MGPGAGREGRQSEEQECESKLRRQDCTESERRPAGQGWGLTLSAWVEMGSRGGKAET